MKELRPNTPESWALPRRPLAQGRNEDGRRQARETGTGPVGVVSSQIVNLDLRYTFDMWMTTDFPDMPFQLCADDAVYNCRSKAQADPHRQP